jgi:hypothetical protein
VDRHIDFVTLDGGKVQVGFHPGPILSIVPGMYGLVTLGLRKNILYCRVIMFGNFCCSCQFCDSSVHSCSKQFVHGDTHLQSKKTGASIILVWQARFAVPLPSTLCFDNVWQARSLQVRSPDLRDSSSVI